MRAGALRHRVELQQPTETRDSHGGVRQTWATVQTVYASVEPIGGKEYFAAQQVQSDTTHRVRLRWNPDFTPTTKWRVRYDGRDFDIEAVIEMFERQREWHLMCKERHQDGFRVSGPVQSASNSILWGPNADDVIYWSPNSDELLWA